MTWLKNAVMALCVIAFSNPLLAEEPKGDLKKLQGTWISKDESGESSWTFKDDAIHLKTPTREYKGKVKLDEKGTPFSTMDLAMGDDSPNAKGVTGLCIYKIEDKKVTICFSTTSRPKEFKAQGFEAFLFELKLKE